MALTTQSYQFLSQQGLLRLVDPSGDAEGPKGTVSYWLVPANGYINGQRAPHAVETDIADQKYNKTEVEGIEYFLVPEESSNTPGLISHYAQRTGAADLANPLGGVNRAREGFVQVDKAEHITVAPDSVAKYVKDNDAFEEARKKESEQDARVNRQVSVSPAREPAEGKLVVADQADDSQGTKESSEKPVKPAGKTS